MRIRNPPLGGFGGSGLADTSKRDSLRSETGRKIRTNYLMDPRSQRPTQPWIRNGGLVQQFRPSG